ncbi:transcriptional attenuator, LytR family [Marinococcus luteus]|uniref:Transcriptional attenuator, LytR family n=1 Tax=Marinococcus luteus TaxID=1122204 RepID=A0A1H2QJ44_9BACI|nr:LCP family protein [Marinococcus luteus]SDW06940.1 transcriptional attenuator, LytR family [Marinococcus luteus]
MKWKKIVLIIGTSLGVMLVVAGSYGWNLVATTFTAIQEDVDRAESENRLDTINFDEGDPFSVLLMGVDESGGADDPNQRTDALVLLTVNPDTKSTQMVSIPRDTYTTIAGEGEKDKINHAYAFGGKDETIHTVEQFLDVPVDYFFQADMAGFEDMVDTINGVSVENSFAFTYKGTHFAEGSQELNGEEALKYARMRKDDPRGDLGRQERQRDLLLGMMDKGTDISSVPKIKSILTVVEDHVRTNFQLKDVWTVQSNYQPAFDQVKQHEIEGEDGEMDDTYYYMPDTAQVQELSDRLNHHLEIEQTDQEA